MQVLFLLNVKPSIPIVTVVNIPKIKYLNFIAFVFIGIKLALLDLPINGIKYTEVSNIDIQI